MWTSVRQYENMNMSPISHHCHSYICVLYCVSQCQNSLLYYPHNWKYKLCKNDIGWPLNCHANFCCTSNHLFLYQSKDRWAAQSRSTWTQGAVPFNPIFPWKCFTFYFIILYYISFTADIVKWHAKQYYIKLQRS